MTHNGPGNVFRTLPGLDDGGPMKRKRWYLDTEFNEDGRTIELISIGLVSDAGDWYYAHVAGYDAERCNDWVKKHVLPIVDKMPQIPRLQVADEIHELLLADRKPELWGYFADYDWVAFCQLYGPMVNLPEGYPRFCMDIKQRMRSLNIEKSQLPVQEGTEHDALADARWNRTANQFLDQVEKEGWRFT